MRRYPQLWFSRGRAAAPGAGWSAWSAAFPALRPGRDGMAACDQVAVPARDRVRAYQQPQSAQHVPRQPVQQGSQERAIAHCETDVFAAELASEHHDLAAQREDFRIPLPIAHAEQTQQRVRVRHGQIGQSKQHS